MNTVCNQRGFTLIEVVISLGVLAFGILALMLMQVSTIKGNATSRTITEESNRAADRIEQLLNVGYNDDLLVDTDGDGTGKDDDEDGVDDGGSIINFGLDDIGVSSAGACTPAPADFCFHDQDYDIFWNIAVDHPMTGTKTIKVIVKHTGNKPNQIVFQYVKADII